MKKSIRITLITAASCTAIVAVGVVPAFADSTPAPSPTKTAVAHRSLADIQAAGATKTNQRITSLHTAVDKITADKGLTASDRSTILSTLNADLTGMTTVAAKIAGDTTVGQAAADYATIFTAYRVYAVALPQARFATAADTAVGITIPRLTAVEKRLSARLSGKDSSRSTAALQADLNDMTTQLAKATAASTGVSAAALAVTPAQYDSDHTALAGVKQSVASLRAAIKQARSDAKSVVAALK